MLNKFYTACTVIFSLCISIHAQPFKCGEIINKVQCEDDRDYSYVLYLPSKYDENRADKYPVMFVMSPGGGNTKRLQRYLLGAEKNNWILAMSVESRNSFTKNEQAIEAMIEDVFDRFLVNKKRCYASGMSGGGRETFALANKMKSNIIGIIPCGAGDSGSKYQCRALAYGLCGGKCFNRWDMALTFYERIKDDGRLRFFNGGHVWADEALLFDAMTWLNAKYLAKKGSKTEIDQFSEMLFGEIKKKYEDDPYFAYENATVLSELKKAPHAAQTKKILAKLKTDPRIKLYSEAVEDMDDFCDEHFSTDVMDCYNNRCTSTQKKDAQKLLAKYRTTPLAKTIEQFGEPSKNFSK